MSDDSTPVEVDVNTDNQDDFDNLFFGKAVEKVEEAEEVTPDDDTVATGEEEAPEDEDVDDDLDEPEEEEEIDLTPKPKNRKTFQERINELTKAAREAERREADALRALAEARSVKKTEPEAPPVARTQLEAGAPDPDVRDEHGELVYPLGEFDPKFIRDITRFTIRQEDELRRADEAQRAEERQEQEAHQKLASAWNDKLATSEKDLPDLRPTIASLEETFRDVEPSYGMYLTQTIMGLDSGPEVLYYLANNVDEANKIVAAGPIGATIALGKLEARIQNALSKKAANPVRVSTAPEPAKTTRGTGARLSVAADTDDLDAFEKTFFKRK